MRNDFVQYIKNRIDQKPDYKSTLEELRMEMLLAGATDQEFNEAIAQMETGQKTETQAKPTIALPPKPPVVPTQEIKPIQKKDTSFVKKLIELDITAHAITAVLILSFFSFFAWKYLQNNTTTNFPLQKNQSLSVKTETLIPKVYADSTPVDPNTIFSISPSSVTLAISGTPKKDIFGFFPYWMLDDEDKVSLNALTTLSLFGIEIDGKGNIVTNNGSQIDGGWSMWNNSKLNDLLQRAKSRKIKVVLTIKVFNNTDIESIVTNDAAQKNFIANVKYLINEKSLDGVNLDFEYVGTPTNSVRNNFTRLVTNLNTEMKREYPQSLLTIDTYVTSASTIDLFDLSLLAPHIDAFVIMGYDFHTPSGGAGPVAPLEGETSILTSVQSYLDKVTPDKLILAVPYYGYDWVVPNVNQSNAAVMIPYAQVNEQSKKYTINWDDASQTPWYSYADQLKQTHQVYFENVRSLGEKYDLINRKNLRGVGLWALGYDGLNSDLRELLLEKFATSN